MSRLSAWQSNPFGAPQQPTFHPSMLGPVELVQPPTGQILTLERAKKQCRVDHDDDDEFIRDLIDEAAEYIEQEIPGGICLMPRVYDVPVAGWWGAGPLRLPFPLLDVLSVGYRDSANVAAVLDDTLYRVRTPQWRPGTIERAVGVTTAWPSLYGREQYPVTIRVVAGFADASLIPKTLKRAALLIISGWYDNRESLLRGRGGEVPHTVTALLNAAGTPSV